MIKARISIKTVHSVSLINPVVEGAHILPLRLPCSPSGKTNIYLDTVHPMGPRGLEKVEEVDAILASKQAPQEASQPDKAFQKPWFIVPLQPEFELGETEPLHLQCNVEPKEDPKLNVEWHFNGKPLSHGKWRGNGEVGMEVNLAVTNDMR